MFCALCISPPSMTLHLWIVLRTQCSSVDPFVALSSTGIPSSVLVFLWDYKFRGQTFYLLSPQFLKHLAMCLPCRDWMRFWGMRKSTTPPPAEMLASPRVRLEKTQIVNVGATIIIIKEKINGCEILSLGASIWIPFQGFHPSPPPTVHSSVLRLMGEYYSSKQSNGS